MICTRLITFNGLFTNKIDKKLTDGTVMHIPLVVQASWQQDMWPLREHVNAQ